MSRAGLVWEIKVRFVRVCARNGPCVGKGRGLNGGVVQSGASGRPPSDPHPRSEPLLVASHSERTPSLAVPTSSSDIPPLSIASLLTLPGTTLRSPQIPRVTRSFDFTRTRRAFPKPQLNPRLLYRLPPALVFACLYL